MPERLLDVHQLSVERWIDRRWVRVIDPIDLSLEPRDLFGLVGESGSGKSTLLQALAGLLPQSTTRVHGRVRLGDIELLELNEAGWRELRGRALCWLPQNPMNAFNPVARLGAQISALIAARTGNSRRQANDALRHFMQQLALPDDGSLLDRYPSEISGGQRQRLLMAMALSCKPRLLLADEPASALDNTSRSAMLESLHQACRDSGISILTVSHDLALVAGHCERLAVMYCGQIVESGPVRDLFEHPAHPYTAALLAAHPAVAFGATPGRRPEAIRGQPPASGQWPDGCRFAERCGQSQPICHQREPSLDSGSGGRRWRCHFPLR